MNRSHCWRPAPGRMFCKGYIDGTACQNHADGIFSRLHPPPSIPVILTVQIFPGRRVDNNLFEFAIMVNIDGTVRSAVPEAVDLAPVRPADDQNITAKMAGHYISSAVSTRTTFSKYSMVRSSRTRSQCSLMMTGFFDSVIVDSN